MIALHASLYLLPVPVPQEEPPNFRLTLHGWGTSDPQLDLVPPRGFCLSSGYLQLYLAGHCVHGKPQSVDEELPEKAFKWSLERNGNWDGVQTPLQLIDKRRVVFVTRSE